MDYVNSVEILIVTVFQHLFVWNAKRIYFLGIQINILKTWVDIFCSREYNSIKQKTEIFAFVTQLMKGIYEQ